MNMEREEFREQFFASARPLYPLHLLDDLQDYHPAIIGHDHEHQQTPLILQAVAQKGRNRVGYEISPQDLEWTRDFFEYIKNGEFDAAEIRRQNSYRFQIHWRALAIDLMERDMELVSLESADIYRWKDEAERDVGLHALQKLGMNRCGESGHARALPFFKDVKRNVFSLHRIHKEKPPLIVTGSSHAFVYDLLLNPEENVEYMSPHARNYCLGELETFKLVHDLYMERRGGA
jgi:hypothetical protein